MIEFAEFVELWQASTAKYFLISYVVGMFTFLGLVAFLEWRCIR